MLSGKNLDQPAIGLQQTSPTGAGSKVALELIPINSMTLSDGHGRGERAPSSYMHGSIGLRGPVSAMPNRHYVTQGEG